MAEDVRPAGSEFDGAFIQLDDAPPAFAAEARKHVEAALAGRRPRDPAGFRTCESRWATTPQAEAFDPQEESFDRDSARPATANIRAWASPRAASAWLPRTVGAGASRLAAYEARTCRVLASWLKRYPDGRSR